MPHTHNDQSFTNANRDFGRMPHTHNDQSYTNFANPTPPNQYNFNTPVDNLGYVKVNKSATEKNQFLTQKKVLDRIKKTIDSKLLEIEHIFEGEELITEPVTIELLEDHGSWLESQKTFISKKSSIVAQMMSTLQPTSPVFDDFLDLEQEFNTVEKQIITTVNKIKKENS